MTHYSPAGNSSFFPESAYYQPRKSAEEELIEFLETEKEREEWEQWLKENEE